MQGVRDFDIDIDTPMPGTEGMPEELKARLLVTLELGRERFNCKNEDLWWKVEPNGLIRVKPKVRA